MTGVLLLSDCERLTTGAAVRSVERFSLVLGQGRQGVIKALDVDRSLLSKVLKSQSQHILNKPDRSPDALNIRASLDLNKSSRVMEMYFQRVDGGASLN